MHSHYLELNWGKLHYQTRFASHKKTLLLLHSFNSSAASFDKLCELLKDQFNLVCLDLPGHGLSSHLDITQYGAYYSFAGFTAAALACVQHLKLDQFYIVGNSVGGNAAVSALPQIKSLKGLILMGSIQVNSKEKAFEMMDPSPALDLLFKEILSGTEAKTLASAYVHSTQAPGFAQMVQDIQNTDGLCRESFSQSLETWLDEPKLRNQSGLPVLYILGKNDGFINVQRYKEELLSQGVKESQICCLDHASHVPHLDNPKECAKLIADFTHQY